MLHARNGMLQVIVAFHFLIVKFYEALYKLQKKGQVNHNG